VKNEDEIIGGADYERNFSKRQLWYARTEAERDTIEGVDLRATGATGYGYYFIRNDTKTLRGRLGVQYRHEQYTSGREEEALSPEFGLRYETPLSTWAKLTSEITYAPAFDAPSDYRVDHTSAVDIPLTATKRLSLRFEITNSYNSTAEEGIDKMDTVYLARLVLKLP
jgi:putative salt-induced outer membrane protein YdiY